MKQFARNLSLIVGSIMLLLVLTVTAQAATITVTSDADTASEDADCTLREAIIAANDNTNAHEDDCTAGEASPVVDEIVFDATAFPPDSSTTIDLGSNLDDITESVNITGPGYNALTIDGDGNADMGFVIDSSSDDQIVSIEGLTVANMSGATAVGISVAVGDTLNLFASRVTGTSGDAATGLGNAGGTVSVTSSIIDTNASSSSGGGIVNTDDTSTPGTMTIISSLITGNDVSGTDNDGGGILNENESSLTITLSLVSNNSTDDDGGGIYNDNATLTVTGSQITGNTASGSSSDEFGGGIANDNGGTVTIEEHSVISNNTAEQAGGGVSNDKESTMTITDSTLSSNITTNGGGGGALNFGGSHLDIVTSTISDNNALDFGGGIYNANNVTEPSMLTLDASTIARNTTEVLGGGIANIGPNSEATITNSTIADNNSLEAAGIGNAFVASCVTIENSTISGNTATNDGGGIADGNSDNACSQGYAVSLLNVTITENLSNADLDDTNGGGGGGIAVADTSGDFNITNTIIAGNFDPFIGPDCATVTGPDGIQSGGHNLIGTLDGCDDNDFDNGVLMDQIGVDPMLDFLMPLNGGDPANGIPTGVHYPLDGSPAIDNGDTAAAPPTDQLGVPRPMGEPSDIGAVESGCGNGITETGEECDDGGESVACNANCTTASCGDGIVNATRGEECDDAGESDTCNANCTLKGVGTGICGNGVVEGDEECDDGGESEDCNITCTIAECGDGILNRTSGEVCEDGNTIDGDTCSSTCKKEQNVSCTLMRVTDSSGPGYGAMALLLLFSVLGLGLARSRN